jgi:hypothetical protein
LRSEREVFSGSDRNLNLEVYHETDTVLTASALLVYKAEEKRKNLNKIGGLLYGPMRLWYNSSQKRTPFGPSKARISL